MSSLWRPPDVLMPVNALVRFGLGRRGVRSEVVDVLGHRVAHYVAEGAGKGPPVLLVHGLGGSANGYAQLLSALTQRFSSVYALDLPGSGFSPDPKSGPLSIFEQYDVLTAYARDIVRAPAFVIGNSLGGAMALKLACEYPAQVQALTLISPAGAQWSAERFAEVLRLYDVRSGADVRKLLRRLFHRAPRAGLLLSPLIVSQYRSGTVRRFLKETQVTDALTPELLAKLSAPTLLLWGGSDRVLPEESVEYFKRHLPAARIEIVPGFGHVPQMERPEEVLKRLVGFADALQL
jgi:pimeloyl-ACP methyl ester carboxylesterase